MRSLARNAIRVALSIGMVALGAQTLPGTFSSAVAGASDRLAGQTIVLYSAQHEQTTAALAAAFTRQSGIRVRVDSNVEDVLTAQVEQEGSRSPADVVYTENSNWLQQLDNRRLLAKVASPTLANVPRRDNARDGDWVGVSARVSAMVYNPSKVSAAELPTSILSLADPRFRGRLELAPSETDFWPIVSSVAQAKGDAATVKWLEGIKENAGPNANVPDNETLTNDVSRGTVAIGLLNQYYWYRYQAEVGKRAVQSRLAYFAPRDPGYVEGISGAAVLRSSTHRAAAQAFLSFLTSDAGQSAIQRSDSFEYPIHPGVAANPSMPPLSQLQPCSFTPAQLGAGLDAKRLLQQVGLL